MPPKAKKEKAHSSRKIASSSSIDHGASRCEFPILAPLKLFASAITGDGNCLFRSFSDQIYGDSLQNRLIRSNVVKYMRAHSEYFSIFFDSPYDESWEEYLDRMDRDGVYGDNLEIVAFAKMYAVDVVVYQADFMYVINGIPNPATDDDFYDFTQLNVKIDGIDKIITLADDEGELDNENDDAEYEPKRVMVYTDDLTGEKKEIKLPYRIHIAYHTWEHYSSVRNLAGPFTGPPEIAYITLTANLGTDQPTSDTSGKRKIKDNDKWKIETVMSSLPPSDGPTVTKLKVKRLLKERKGDVDAVIEILLEEMYNQDASKEVANADIDNVETDTVGLEQITHHMNATALNSDEHPTESSTTAEVSEPAIETRPKKTQSLKKTNKSSVKSDSKSLSKKRESAREKKERQKRESRERKKKTKDPVISEAKSSGDAAGFKILYV